MDRNAMFFIAMGFEAVGVVLVSMWLGQQLGERYGWGMIASAIGAFVGLVGWVVHLLLVARMLAQRENSSDGSKDSR